MVVHIAIGLLQCCNTSCSRPTLLSAGDRLSVRPSITLVDCIQTTEDIVKLLSRPVSPIILVFVPERQYPIPRWTSSEGAQITREWENFAIFDGNLRLSL